MYKKNMEKDNQNIYILNIYMSHFRDKKYTCNHKDTVSELEINLNFLTIYTCSDITAIPFMGKSKASYKFPLVFIFSFINDFCKHHHKITVANYVKICLFYSIVTLMKSCFY